MVLRIVVGSLILFNFLKAQAADVTLINTAGRDVCLTVSNGNGMKWEEIFFKPGDSKKIKGIRYIRVDPEQPQPSATPRFHDLEEPEYKAKKTTKFILKEVKAGDKKHLTLWIQGGAAAFTLDDPPESSFQCSINAINSVEVINGKPVPKVHKVIAD